jgi:hypothetical protein
MNVTEASSETVLSWKNVSNARATPSGLIRPA